MKTFTLTAAVVAAALIAGGPALAQTKTKANCQPSASARGDAAGPKTAAPEKIDGQVVNVDPSKGMITVRNKDGTTHEFKGDADTLKQYKAGDNIELTLRAQPC
jgi:hypothetical protein